MRPQSPSLDATNDNENIRSDEYLKLQGTINTPTIKEIFNLIMTR